MGNNNSKISPINDNIGTTNVNIYKYITDSTLNLSKNLSKITINDVINSVLYILVNSMSTLFGIYINKYVRSKTNATNINVFYQIFSLLIIYFGHLTTSIIFTTNDEYPIIKSVAIIWDSIRSNIKDFKFDILICGIPTTVLYNLLLEFTDIGTITLLNALVFPVSIIQSYYINKNSYLYILEIISTPYINICRIMYITINI